MKRTATYIAIAAFTLVIGIAVWGIYYFDISRQHKPFNKWEFANKAFRIRISAYKERAMFTPGAYYVFESANVGSDSWRGIMTIMVDEPHPIQPEQVHFVSEHIGYIFISSYYMVTTDAGHTWFVWNGAKDLLYEQYKLSPYIRELEVQPDGNGIMKLYPQYLQNEIVPDLTTKDYGHNWTIQ